MIQEINLVGQRFGRLVAIERFKGDDKKDYTRWVCLCDCGNQKIIARASLRNGETQSCGCLQKEDVSRRQKTHGKSRTKEYYSWRNMLRRCYDVNSVGYENYGGRGISVCNDWHIFENFLADMGLKPEGYSIERIDNDGNYEKNNCKWATKQEQNSNTRQNRIITYNNKTQTLEAWARELNISSQTLSKRLDAWNDVEKAFTTPVRKRKST